MGDGLAVVLRAYESFLKDDLPPVLALLDPDVVWEVPRSVPHGGTFTGHAGILEFFSGVDAAWNPFNLHVETVGEIGHNLVAGLASVSGVLAGSPISYRAMHLFTVENGMITRFQEFFDLDGALAG